MKRRNRQILQEVCEWNLDVLGRSSFETLGVRQGSSASFAASHQGCQTFLEEVRPYFLLHHHQNEEVLHHTLGKKRHIT